MSRNTSDVKGAKLFDANLRNNLKILHNKKSQYLEEAARSSDLVPKKLNRGKKVSRIRSARP